MLSQLAKSLTYNNLQLTSPFVYYYFIKSWEYLGVNLFGGNEEKKVILQVKIKKQRKKHIVYYEKKLIRLGIVLHIRGKVGC